MQPKIFLWFCHGFALESGNLTLLHAAVSQLYNRDSDVYHLQMQGVTVNIWPGAVKYCFKLDLKGLPQIHFILICFLSSC